MRNIAEIVNENNDKIVNSNYIRKSDLVYISNSPLGAGYIIVSEASLSQSRPMVEGDFIPKGALEKACWWDYVWYHIHVPAVSCSVVFEVDQAIIWASRPYRIVNMCHTSVLIQEISEEKGVPTLVIEYHELLKTRYENTDDNSDRFRRSAS